MELRACRAPPSLRDNDLRCDQEHDKVREQKQRDVSEKDQRQTIDTRPRGIHRICNTRSGMRIVRHARFVRGWRVSHVREVGTPRSDRRTEPMISAHFVQASLSCQEIDIGRLVQVEAALPSSSIRHYSNNSSNDTTFPQHRRTYPRQGSERK